MGRVSYLFKIKGVFSKKEKENIFVIVFPTSIDTSQFIFFHPNFFETIPIKEAKDLFHSITPDNNLQQLKAAWTRLI
jgi:hypothetical protein